MSKIRTYIYALRRSVSDPDYYLTLLRTRLRFSIFFFITTLAILSLALLPYSAERRLPQAVEYGQIQLGALVDQVPDSTVFSLADHRLSVSGASLPIQIAATQEMQEMGVASKLIEIRPDEESGDAFLTIGPTAVVVHSSSGTEQLPYAEIDEEAVSFSLTKPDIQNGVRQIATTLLARRWQIASILSLFFFFSHLFSGTFMILLYSILVQGLAWIFGAKLSYGQAARWGLHIYPIVLTLAQISLMLSPGSTFPIMSVGYLAITLLLVWNMRARIQHHFAR